MEASAACAPTLAAAHGVGRPGGCPTRAEAIHTFVPQGDEKESQLALSAGDLIEVLEKDGSGWWAGFKDGNRVTGWFPSAAVRELGLDEQQGIQMPSARGKPRPNEACETSSCSVGSSSTISTSQPTAAATQVSRSARTSAGQASQWSTCSSTIVTPRCTWDSQKAAALTTADGRRVASPLGTKDGRRFATPLSSRDRSTATDAEKLGPSPGYKDVRKAFPASPAPKRTGRNSQCTATPQSARDTGANRRLTTPLSRRAASPRTAEAAKDREPKGVAPSPSPVARRAGARQVTPQSARSCAQKAIGVVGNSPASGQIAHLRQASRRLTAPSAPRDAQTSRLAASRNASNSQPTPGTLSASSSSLVACSSTTCQERSVNEKNIDDESEHVRLRLLQLEQTLGRVQADMRGKEFRLLSLEHAHASLRAQDGCTADVGAPSVRDLIATFEQRSGGRVLGATPAIPTGRRSLPAPESRRL